MNLYSIIFKILLRKHVFCYSAKHESNAMIFNDIKVFAIFQLQSKLTLGSGQQQWYENIILLLYTIYSTRLLSALKFVYIDLAISLSHYAFMA